MMVHFSSMKEIHAILSLFHITFIMIAQIAVLWHAVRREKMFGGASQNSNTRNTTLRMNRGNRLPFDKTSTSNPVGRDDSLEGISGSPKNNTSSLQDDNVESDREISLTKDKRKLDIHKKTAIDAPATNDRSVMPSQLSISSGEVESEAQERIAANIITSHTADDYSRLYRRELMTQLFCYVAVFCVSFVPFIVANILLISGKSLPPPLTRFLLLFFPLEGLFNILIYLRPKVTGLRRAHPGCSRWRAFFLVLKAGGEIPEHVHLPVSFCNFCCTPLHQQQDDEVAHPPRQSSMSSNPIGQVSPPPETANSLSVVDGLSISMSRMDNLYRSTAEWMHIEGDESRMIFCDEVDVGQGKSSHPEASFEVSNKQSKEVSISAVKSVRSSNDELLEDEMT